MEQALEGIMVVDFSTSMAGAWCSRLLADFGADVVMVEPPGGHPLRQLAPHTKDGASIPAMYVQANKRSIALELDQPTGRAVLADLIAASDVVIESTVPGTLAGWEMSFEELEERRPGVILVSVTPYGQDCARAGYPGNDLTTYALSGWASINGLADREPIKGSGFNASYLAGTAAYGATLTALCYREMHGIGQQIDIAEVETQAEIFGRSMLRAQYEDAIPERNTEMHLTGSFPVPVKDGHIAVGLGSGYRFRDALNALGLPEMAEDAELQNPSYRRDHPEAFVPQITARLAEMNKAKLFDALARVRVGSGPVLTMDELATDPHLRERGYYAPPTADPDGPEYPGAPFKMSQTPWHLERGAPDRGAHTTEVMADVAGYGPTQIASLMERGIAIGATS